MSLTLDDIQNLSTEVRALVQAGLPLESHLAEAGAGHRGRLKQLTRDISERMEAGESLEDIVQPSQLDGPRILSAAVVAGVRTGRLAETIEMLGDMASDLVELRRQILHSLAYPLTILATALLLFFTLVRSFLYRVDRALLQDHEFQPPGWLRTSLDLDREYWMWPVLVPIVGALVILSWLRADGGGALAFRGPAKLLFLLPGVKSMVRDLRYYTLVRMLSLMIEREIPLPDALELSGACSGSRKLNSACQAVSTDLRKGHSIDAPLDQDRGHRDLPPLLTVCLQELTVSDDHFVRRVSGLAGYYQRRLQMSVSWLRSVVPVFLFAMVGGGTVLVYTATVFLPVTIIYRLLTPQ